MERLTFPASSSQNQLATACTVDTERPIIAVSYIYSFELLYYQHFCNVQLNPDFSNLQGKQKFGSKNGEFVGKIAVFDYGDGLFVREVQTDIPYSLLLFFFCFVLPCFMQLKK